MHPHCLPRETKLFLSERETINIQHYIIPFNIKQTFLKVQWNLEKLNFLICQEKKNPKADRIVRRYHKNRWVESREKSIHVPSPQGIHTIGKCRGKKSGLGPQRTDPERLTEWTEQHWQTRVLVPGSQSSMAPEPMGAGPLLWDWTCL